MKGGGQLGPGLTPEGSLQAAQFCHWEHRSSRALRGWGNNSLLQMRRYRLRPSYYLVAVCCLAALPRPNKFENATSGREKWRSVRASDFARANRLFAAWAEPRVGQGFEIARQPGKKVPPESRLSLAGGELHLL
jgi:hypothetical protein